MPDSVQLHRLQPIRLHCPRDSPSKSTGAGCHFLLRCMKVKSENEVAQSCPTLRNPMDYSLPGFSSHGIFQARVLEWGAIAFSRNTWSNRQIWLLRTEWSRAKANRVLPRERTGDSKHLSKNTREDSTHRHFQMLNTEIRLIIYFAAKDGEALYNQQKQDRELTVAQIMNSLLPKSDLNWRK